MCVCLCVSLCICVGCFYLSLWVHVPFYVYLCGLVRLCGGHVSFLGIECVCAVCFCVVSSVSVCVQCIRLFICGEVCVHACVWCICVHLICVPVHVSVCICVPVCCLCLYLWSLCVLSVCAVYVCRYVCGPVGPPGVYARMGVACPPESHLWRV